jgi:hypothetical protein
MALSYFLDWKIPFISATLTILVGGKEFLLFTKPNFTVVLVLKLLFLIKRFDFFFIYNLNFF